MPIVLIMYAVYWIVVLCIIFWKLYKGKLFGDLAPVKQLADAESQVFNKASWLSVS